MGKRSEEIIRKEVNIHTVIKGYVEAFNYVTQNKYQLQYSPAPADSLAGKQQASRGS
jgi:hypothetical protein